MQNDGDQYLGNLFNLLAALDANSDLSDGIVIDAAAQARSGRRRPPAARRVNFSQAPASFAKDPVVAAVLAPLNRSLLDFDEVLAQVQPAVPAEPSRARSR